MSIGIAHSPSAGSGAERVSRLPASERSDKLGPRRHAGAGVQPQVAPGMRIAQFGRRIAATAGNETRKLRPPGRLTGGVVTQVHTPANVFAVVRQRAVR